MNRASRLIIVFSCVAGMLSVGTRGGEQRSAEQEAAEILNATGVKGGLIVHLGCGDGRLTCALRASESYTVHGLEADAVKVASARRHIHARGIYGDVSVEQYSGSVLPYTDNLVNLVVVQEAGKVGMEEVLRVLAPGGAACVMRNGKWQKTVKARPESIDEWTHFLHDASNNAVARDSVIGPPRRIQWVAPPLWLRSHETPSGIQAPVSAGGRLFYIFDEGPIGITDERLPDRWSLICRDAFNGRLLWRRSLGPWGWRQWSRARYEGKDWTTLRAARTDVPNENQRRIVAEGDRLYVTLAYSAAMSILDAATGDVVTTVEATRGTREILASEGIVVAYAQRPQDKVSGGGTENAGGTALIAVDGRSGEVLWDRQVGQIRPLALAIDNGRIVYISGKDLVARNLRDGRELWRVRPKSAAPRTLVAVDDTIVMQGGKLVVAHDAANGQVLWQKTAPPISGGEGDDLFVIDGLVWRGMLSVDENAKPVSKSPNVLVIGWDLRSGEEKKRIFVKDLRSPEHHHRCYRNKATTRYLISSYEGAEFLDFQGDNHSQNNWLRGACRYGMSPGRSFWDIRR
jgi:SAM-dependent methyltransferase